MKGIVLGVLAFCLVMLGVIEVAKADRSVQKQVNIQRNGIFPLRQQNQQLRQKVFVQQLAAQPIYAVPAQAIQLVPQPIYLPPQQLNLQQNQQHCHQQQALQLQQQQYQPAAQAIVIQQQQHGCQAFFAK